MRSAAILSAGDSMVACAGVRAMGMVRSGNDRMDTGKELPAVSGSRLRSSPLKGLLPTLQTADSPAG